jgi:hypothetical protein
MRGKVLLFTTPLDRREPPWNNYDEQIADAFYLALVGQGTKYLCGEAESVNLNFVLGRDVPQVTLPAAPGGAAYFLRGNELHETISPDSRTFAVKSVQNAGNFVIEARANEKEPGKNLAGFSTNVPSDESDLAKVPAAEIERLFGAGAVVTVERGIGIRQALQDYWSEPVEIFPYVMVLLLLLLALENLLANKFYRQEPA